MFDYQRLFHTGVRVPELDAAMASIGGAAGVEWAEPVKREQPLWTPEGGSQLAHLRFTYSAQGPQHIELLEGEPGSVWDGREQPGVHHVGVWVDDVAAETDAMIAAGWRLIVAHRSPGEGYGGFTYIAPPSGMIVELVSAAALPRFEAWWAGGSL